MTRITHTEYYRPSLQALLCAVFLLCFGTGLHAQTSSDSPTSAEALQSRIERARALVAAHQLETAVSELESVRAVTTDDTIRTVTSVMLMSIYLEEGNYVRAQALLEEAFGSRAVRGDESIRSYFALAGQAVNGARAHLLRYRTFGVNTSDPTLPVEALNDLNRLRSLLERMIAQAKEISGGRRANDSLSLLEDVLGIRLSLAKDAEDEMKWESEYASVREVLATSQTQIASLGGQPNFPAAKLPSTRSSATTSNPAHAAHAEKTTTGAADKQAPRVEGAKSDTATASAPKTAKVAPAKTQDTNKTGEALKPTGSGSLNAKATKRVLPRYPTVARQTRTAGMVRVHVIVDETGRVIEVSRSEGPVLLRKAAEDAARQWSFDSSGTGKPTRYSGFIDFHFVL
ncbi:MAG: TonB family protein [Pyrinomonadaceae bacterium]